MPIILQSETANMRKDLGAHEVNKSDIGRLPESQKSHGHVKTGQNSIS